ncbi:MAG: signal peptide peptidase SppA [Saprospiraceae bacterium]|nr:signal peptide peptidase SppA [Saprospiraceae bacterium]
MKFIKSLLTSCLGTVFGIGAFIGIIFLIAATFGGGTPQTKPNSVLVLSFDDMIPELSNNTAVNPMEFSSWSKQTIGLHDILDLIEYAKTDKNIQGIYISSSGLPGGLATAKKIRDKIEEFKETGKFVYAYSSYFTQKGYYLASVADSVFVHPMGGVDFSGFSGQIMFYKGMMDKIGLKPRIFYAGKFKSATEPFRRKDMTPENRLQVSEYLHGSYRLFLEKIAGNRNTTANALYALADSGAIQDAEDAEENGLVDGLRYKDQVLTTIRSRLGVPEDKKIQSVSIGKYYSMNSNKLRKIGDRDIVAVVVAEGSIVDGQGENGSIGGDKYAKIIRKLRRNDKVKAIVIRVNSGGGSALASDIIWRELEMAKAQGIPVIASMGDVAASGGYYISAGADRIYAEDNTITGSIGVFGMLFNSRELYEDKLGLTMDTVKTGQFSAMGAGSYFDYTDKEAAMIQKSVDQIYMTFKERVAEGRGMTVAEVDSVAQGRVWLGTAALKNGLVDTLGGLSDAVDDAVSRANLAKYKIRYYPEVKTFQEELKANLLGEQATINVDMKQVREQAIREELGEHARMYDALKKVKEMKGIQARLPYELVIE